MTPVQGTQASGTNAAILRVSLMVLGLSLFFVSAARADNWSAGAFTTYDQAEWGDSTNAAGMLLGELLQHGLCLDRRRLRYREHQHGLFC